MELIVSALKIEIESIKPILGNSVKYINCGVKAKNLGFIKEIKSNDHIINIGIAAGKSIGQLYLCNKIIGKDIYYPDLIIKNKMQQSSIKTIENIADQNMITENPNMLFDQEAWHICNAAKKYIAPHQVSFLKIVSDNGIIDKAQIIKNTKKYIQNNAEEIKNYIESSKKFFYEKINLPYDIEVNTIAEKLKCSESVKNQLKQLIIYSINININYKTYFENIENKGQLPPKNKKETLKIINEFKNYLITNTN